MINPATGGGWSTADEATTTKQRADHQAVYEWDFRQYRVRGLSHGRTESASSPIPVFLPTRTGRRVRQGPTDLADEQKKIKMALSESLCDRV